MMSRYAVSRMNDGQSLVRGGIITLLLIAAVLTYSPENGRAIFGQIALLGATAGQCADGTLCVSFLDVGQGDAIFIESPTGVQLLIDGGRTSSVLRELTSHMAFFDDEIDVVLATHPDADHIGGLVDVLERYTVAHILMTENEGDAPAAAAFVTAVSEEGASVTYARRGQVYDLGGGAMLEILFPDRNPQEMESNTSSIIARLTFGETSFFLTGDAPKSIEEYLVATDGEHLQSDVLKVGHHGSRTSTAETFLSHVRPDYAVISAGADNAYGHPHVEVTDLLFNAGVEIFLTAESGTVRFTSDGRLVSAEEPS